MIAIKKHIYARVNITELSDTPVNPETCRGRKPKANLLSPISAIG